MIFEDTFVVNAPQDRAWAFVSDPFQLVQCVPGASNLEKIDDRTYRAVLGAKVSFLSVSFVANIKITDIQEPSALVAEGEGTDAKIRDRLKFNARLDLKPAGAESTEIGYKIDVAFSGKLATLGFSVLKGKSKQMADQFAQNIKKRLEAAEAARTEPSVG